MDGLFKLFGLEPRVEICSCTTAFQRCKFTSGRCDPYSYSGTPYTEYIDCKTGELCRTTLQGGCCYA